MLKKKNKKYFIYLSGKSKLLSTVLEHKILRAATYCHKVIKLLSSFLIYLFKLEKKLVYRRISIRKNWQRNKIIYMYMHMYGFYFIIYLLTYYNPSFTITAQFLTPLLVCTLILYMNNGTYSLNSTPNDRFYGKVFMAILFTPRVFVTEKIFFHISFCWTCLTWGLNRRLKSNNILSTMLRRFHCWALQF